jgi:hypothetical protein
MSGISDVTDTYRVGDASKGEVRRYPLAKGRELIVVQDDIVGRGLGSHVGGLLLSMNTIRRAVGFDRRDADGMLLYTKFVALPFSSREHVILMLLHQPLAWTAPRFVVSPLVPSSVTSHCLNAKCNAHALLISH